MPATMTRGNSRPLAACIDISHTRASLRAVCLVGLGQERQAVDESAERRLALARFVLARGGDQLHQVLDAGFGVLAAFIAQRLQVARAIEHQGDERPTRRRGRSRWPSAAIRSRKAFRAARARGGIWRASSATSSRAQSDLGDGARLQRPSAAAACPRRRRRSRWPRARRCTLLPMPRAGTFTTRRKLTSSCGLMRSRRYASASLISLRS